MSLPPLATEEPYAKRFADRDIFDAVRSLIAQGFVFVLLRPDGKAPFGLWKTRDSRGEKTEKVVRRTLQECVSHLTKHPDHSVGIVPDGAGCLIVDCDTYLEGTHEDPPALFAKLFGKHVEHVLPLPSKRPSQVPKMHLFFRTDIAYANKRYGRPRAGSGKFRIRTQRTKKRLFQGDAIGRHYVKAHHPELLPVLADWRESDPNPVPKKRLSKVLVDLGKSSPAIAMTKQALAGLKERNTSEEMDLFRPPKAQWSEGRHFWVNSNAISGAMQGFAEEKLRAHLWAQVPKVKRRKVLDKGEFDRFFDGGYEWGLSQVERNKLVDKGFASGDSYDWTIAAEAEAQAVADGLDPQDAKAALQEGMDKGFENRRTRTGRSG